MQRERNLQQLQCRLRGLHGVHTCSGDVATATARTFVVAYEDVYSCVGYAMKFANSQSEAEECVEKSGGKPISDAVPRTAVFLTDPQFGSASLEVTSFSDKQRRPVRERAGLYARGALSVAEALGGCSSLPGVAGFLVIEACGSVVRSA